MGEVNLEKCNNINSYFLFTPEPKTSIWESIPRSSQTTFSTKKDHNFNNLDFKSVENFGTCLGFLLDFSNSKVNSFNFILDKLMNKFTEWRSNILPMTGRVTLIKLVMSMISSYYMQCTMFPVYLCNEFEIDD